MSLDRHQTLTVIRGATLMGGYSDVLSDHERNVLDEAVRRFRKHGEAIWLTEQEWRVIQEAVGALTAAREAHQAAGKVA